jgi:signal peptidase
VRRIASVVGTAVLVVLMGLAIAIAGVPFATHGKALTVLSGSMVPTFYPGDMIVVRGVDNPNSIPVGTIVTYMPNPDDPTLITHRVIGTGTNAEGDVTYTTQGDANTAADEPVQALQIRGIYLFSLPKLGYVSQWMGGETRTGAMLVGVGLLGYAAYQVIFARRGRRGRAGQATARAPADDDAPQAAEDTPGHVDPRQGDEAPPSART